MHCTQSAIIINCLNACLSAHLACRCFYSCNRSNLHILFFFFRCYNCYCIMRVSFQMPGDNGQHWTKQKKKKTHSTFMEIDPHWSPIDVFIVDYVLEFIARSFFFSSNHKITNFISANCKRNKTILVLITSGWCWCSTIVS